MIEKILEIIFVIFVAAIIIIPINLISGKDCRELDSSTQIISVGRDNEIEGNFFLGMGSIETKQYYFYYRKDGDGYMLDKTETESTKIIEGNHNPSIDIYCHSKKILKVPNGTIVRKFELK